jgi:hypothetical protein
MSLVATVIGFLGDRISDFPIWKTQAWTTLKVPVIVITVIVGITVLVVIISLESPKSRRGQKSNSRSLRDGSTPKVTRTPRGVLRNSQASWRKYVRRRSSN